MAAVSSAPPVAHTYRGFRLERVVNIPWLRLDDQGRYYVGRWSGWFICLRTGRKKSAATFGEARDYIDRYLA